MINGINYSCKINCTEKIRDFMEKFEKLDEKKKSEIMFWVKALMKGLQIPQHAMDDLLYYDIVKQSKK